MFTTYVVKTYNYTKKLISLQDRFTQYAASHPHWPVSLVDEQEEEFIYNPSSFHALKETQMLQGK